MKILNKISLAIMTAMFLLVLGGCGTTGEVEEDTGAASTTGGTTAPPSTTTTAPATRSGTDTTPMTTDSGTGTDSGMSQQDSSTDSGVLAQRTIYFAYDSSTIPDDAIPLLEAHAEYLVNNSNVTFTLEGHCDERGTREYNIALGERRADAVRRMLELKGVSPSQINVISYGEERPARLGHNEDAWQYNRRAGIASSGM